jgi:hypothetical protein
VDRNRAITVSQPAIIPLKTEAIRGDWVTTGSVSFAVLQGGSATLGTLEFPYRDAPSQQDALAQVLAPLDAVIAQLTQVAARLREELGDGKAQPVGEEAGAVVPAAIPA